MIIPNWCPAYERWVKGATDQQYLQSLATKEATAIFQSVQSKPAVRKLAGNPLLLTILALLQRQGTNLPAHRVELYDLCVTTLLDTWGKTKGISTTTTHFTKHELIKILRPLAFWMHEHPAVGAIPEEELIEQVVKQLLNRKITRHEDEARKLAEEFLRKVRGETGILIERGKKRYGFLHLTFEEYLAAGELEQREDCKDFIKAHLHDSRWREVIQLTVGIPGILQHNERVATELVRSAILEAESPFEHWLHRDLLLAGICLADDVGIDMECEDEIIERILCLALTSPYGSLQENISSILTSWQSTRLAEKALKMILPVLQQHDVLLDPLVRVAQLSSRTYSRLLERAVTHHYQTIMQYSRESAMRLTRLRTMIPLCNPQIDRQEWTDFALASSHDPDWRVREGTAELLGQLENNRPEVFQRLLDFLSDAHSDVRQASAKALGALGHREEEVITKLLALLTESNWRSKQIAVETLGQLDCKEPRIREHLLRLLSDTDTESRKEIQPQVTRRLMELLNHPFAGIRQATVSVVGQFYCIAPEVIEKLLDLLYDANSDVRLAATKALKQLGNRDTEVLHRLSVVLAEMSGPALLLNTHILKDLDDERRGLNWHITMRLLNVVKRLGKGHTFLTETLFDFLADPEYSYVRETVTEALGELRDESQAVREKLVELLTDHNASVRKAAIRGLSQLGESQPEIASTLLLYLFDYDSDVQESALEALQGSQGNLSNKIHIILNSLTGIYPLNNKNYRRYQQEATKLLKRLLLQQPETTASLLHIVSDRSADYPLKRVAAKVLGQAGDRQSDVVQQLLTMLVAPESSRIDQENLITALGLLGKGHPEVIETLLNFSLGSYPSTFLLEAVAQALGELGDEQPRATAKLFDFLPDSSLSALNSGVSVSAQQIAIEALGRTSNKEPETLARLFDLLSHTNSQIRTSAIETLGQLGDGQPEITAKFVELLSSTGRNERDAALIALAKQSKEPMQVMDILLKSLVNPIAKRTWESAISYILAASEVDRVALSQQLEKLLSYHELITKSNLTATTQVDLVFFALQQIVGNVI